jgi:hypothetical protein
MATAALSRDSTGSTTPMDLNALLLRLWEAANTQREIQGILVEVADVLGPTVPFRAVSGFIQHGGPATAWNARGPWWNASASR